VITKRSKKEKEYMQSEREQNIERIGTQIQRERGKCKIYERKEFLYSFPRRRDI